MHRSCLKCCALLVGLAVFGFAQAGCETTPKATAEAVVAPGAVGWCKMCGQTKGSTLCCQPGQANCAGCGRVKGSPGCCKMPKKTMQ